MPNAGISTKNAYSYLREEVAGHENYVNNLKMTMTSAGDSQSLLNYFKLGCIDESPEGVAKWFQNLGHRKEKLTTFKLYLHDQVSGKNPTAIVVARANFTSKTPAPIPFGKIVVIDDPLIVGPELNSTVMARAQGIYLSDGQEEFVLNMNFNFVFTSGKNKGSTLSLFGQNPVFHQYRELSIVGGTGFFD
ncbi:hypothetical protein RHSIM_Rhsim13G0230100 [Rhododendron simsii]|uniref:Dirigent protein n=1 Tax=Rhododendron simsii TaxID=118357 RepID=A0A834G683_RHOSS|nr:hypothetical protein RHSIM_Rhsim13G0230100 [Rhododendron simsii]